MTQKALSLSTAAAILIAYLWSQLQPGAALFLLMPPNMAVNVGLLIMAALLVRLSFMNKFRTNMSYLLTAGGAVFCLLFGSLGVMAAGLNYSFLSWFGPLDFLLLTEAGTIMALCALAYEHQPVILPALSLPKWSMPKFSFELPRVALRSLRRLSSG